MPTRRCTCPTFARRSGRFSSSRKSPAARAAATRAAACWCRRSVPEHPAIQAAVRHDFDAFARQELPIREAHRYPPVAAMVRLVVRGKRKNIRAFAEHFGISWSCKKAPAGVRADLACSGRRRGRSQIPRAIPFSHANAQHRWRTTCDWPFSRASDGLQVPDDMIWTVDVDPLDML